MYKEQTFRQHVVQQQQVSYAAILSNKATPAPQDKTFNFTAEKIVSLVTNVALSIARPELCHKDLNGRQVREKANLCKQVSTITENVLGVFIEGKEVSESIISWPAPSPPTPFTFKPTASAPRVSPPKAQQILQSVIKSNAAKSNTTINSGPRRSNSSTKLDKTTKPTTKK